MEYIYECIDIGIKAAVGQLIIGLLVTILAIMAMFVWAVVDSFLDGKDDRSL
jgi:hypothetical protein